ncbi:MAG: PAS domain-containing protein [Hyphococcus sp.]
MSVSQPVYTQPDSSGATPDSAAAIARISDRLNNIDVRSFLNDYALGIAEELSADYFAIGRLNPYSNIMRTLRFVANSALTDNLVYSLDGTPCADTINSGVCVHSEDVADTYPRDKELAEFEICSYAGVSLETGAGEKIGVLVAMWKTPLHNKQFVLDVLGGFRQRVASVIETTEALSRYSWAVANVFNGVWDWDLRTGGTALSKELQNLIGGRNGKGPYDLAHVENAIHPDDRPKHVDAIKRHLNEGAPYDMRLRLRNASGVYRWYVSRGSAIRDASGRPERMIGGFCDINDIVVSMEKAGHI